MNIKELEAKVLELGAVINAQAGEIQALKQRMEVEEGSLGGAITALDRLSEKVSEMRDHEDGMNDTLAGVASKLEEITAKVEGRNKSAAVKRNMTDADARRVLDGDLGEIGHKEAAEQIGLTYAQVYSCRMLHTFKHVHKVLDGLKWKNPWVK